MATSVDWGLAGYPALRYQPFEKESVALFEVTKQMSQLKALHLYQFFDAVPFFDYIAAEHRDHSSISPYWPQLRTLTLNGLFRVWDWDLPVLCDKIRPSLIHMPQITDLALYMSLSGCVRCVFELQRDTPLLSDQRPQDNLGFKLDTGVQTTCILLKGYSEFSRDIIKNWQTTAQEQWGTSLLRFDSWLPTVILPRTHGGNPECSRRCPGRPWWEEVPREKYVMYYVRPRVDIVWSDDALE